LVFPDQKGNKIERISYSFERAVQKLGLNKDVTDPRDKVVFHTLRHTFASWLVQAGTPLYTVKELLGHKSIAMTERYSHLAENTMRDAIKNLENELKK
jgi:site-specific recombinase XerD